MSICISQIVATLRSGHVVCRTLSQPRMCISAHGRATFHVGNSAVVVKVTLGDDAKPWAMKCYTRRKERLRQIYGEAFLPGELFVYDISGRGEWIDVVIREWVEGTTLDEAVHEAVAEQSGQRLAELSRMFDRMSADLLLSERAHGDLKPENILLANGGMSLIDWDAAWLPTLGECMAVETGTPDWQHPARTADIYDKSIDDYPVAVIGTMLASLAADCRSLAPLLDAGGRLFSPAAAVAGRDRALMRAEEILARAGDAAHYRIARLLHSPTPRLPMLAELISYALRSPDGSSDFRDAELMRSRTTACWGYMRRGEWVTPPLYDEGFEPSDGVALVRIGGFRHFITADMRSVVECSMFDSVKPMRAGRAVAVKEGECYTIDLHGGVERTF
ncbi:MAG: WG repeat-containing protein [Alistipes sp.]|nr:WG repeat-containing protein [Alistipes sp.]